MEISLKALIEKGGEDYTPQSIDQSKSALHASKLMATKNCGTLLVTDNGKHCGILSERDIVFKATSKNELPESILISDLMHSEVIFCSVNETIHDALEKMKEGNFRNIPVKDEEDHICAVISQKQIISYLESLLNK